jgi:hypothetical protein
MKDENALEYAHEKMILKKQKEIDMGMQFKLGQAENENSDELLDIYSNDSFIHFQNKYLKI